MKRNHQQVEFFLKKEKSQRSNPMSAKQLLVMSKMVIIMESELLYCISSGEELKTFKV